MPPFYRERTLYSAPDSCIYGSFHGRMRPFRDIADLEYAGWSPADVVMLDHIGPFPVAPIMPRVHHYAGIAEALNLEQSIDMLRQVFVQDFRGSGYEIGAGSRPTMVHHDAKVQYIDAFTFEEAADASFVGQENVGFVPVDIRGRADDLRDVPDESADFFIMCHVIEHVANPLLALRELYAKLRSGGRLFLVIPWRDYTFDRHRPVTTLHHMVADYIVDDRARDLQHYLEFFALAACDPDWLAKGQEAHVRTRDNHHHVFTPPSFRELLNYATTLDPWASIQIETPAAAPELWEFYAILTK